MSVIREFGYKRLIKAGPDGSLISEVDCIIFEIFQFNFSKFFLNASFYVFQVSVFSTFLST